jgi:hypothetical protein
MKPAGASVCRGMVHPYLVKGRYCNIAFIKGSANFIFITLPLRRLWSHLSTMYFMPYVFIYVLGTNYVW